MSQAHWKWNEAQNAEGYPTYPYYPWHPIRAGDKVYVLNHIDVYVTTGVKQFNGLIGVRNERNGAIGKVEPACLRNILSKTPNTIEYIAEEDQKPEKCARKGDEKIFHVHDLVIKRNTYRYNKQGTFQLAICSRCDLHQHVWVYTEKQTKDKEISSDSDSDSTPNIKRKSEQLDNKKKKPEEDEESESESDGHICHYSEKHKKADCPNEFFVCVCGGEIDIHGKCTLKSIKSKSTLHYFKRDGHGEKKKIITGGEIMNSLVKKQFKPKKKTKKNWIDSPVAGCDGIDSRELQFLG